MHIYEYLFVSVIVVSILISSITMVDIISQPSRDASSKDLLKIATEKTMTQILLDPGFPFDWGNNHATPQTFGLAKYDQTSREAYLLDADKVQRLNPNIGTAYLQPNQVLTALNLGNDYGFTIEISENLNVTLQSTSSSEATFDVSVISNTNLIPVKNAKVAAALYDIDSSGSVEQIRLINGVTSYDGKCQIDFNYAQSQWQAPVVVLVVDYYGIRCVKILPVIESQIITGYLIGNRVVTNQDYTLITDNGQPLAKEVIVTKQNNEYIISNFNAGTSDASGKLILENNPEPSTIALLAPVRNPDGSQTMLAAFRDFNINYRTIPSVRSTSFSCSLERSVQIAGTTYTMTLYMWRMTI